MKRALPILLLVACRTEPAPPVEDVPEALLYAGPVLRHARTSVGMPMAFCAAEDSDVGAVALLLPRGTSHDGETPGAAVMAAAMLKRSGVSRMSSTGPVDGETLANTLEALGIELAVDAEAEHLLLRATGPSSQTARMVGTLCALGFHPWWTEQVMDAAMGELADAAEERSRGSPWLVEEVLREELFKGHVLGRPAIPSLDSLAAVQLVDVARWHAGALNPQHSLLILSGREGDDVRRAAETCRVADAAPPSVSVSAPIPRTSKGPLHIHVELPETETSYIRIGSRAPVGGSAEANALGLVMEAMANGFSSRLVQRLRTERGLVYGVEGGVVGGRHAGMWSVSSSTARSNAREVSDIMEKELDLLFAEGLPAPTWKKFARANALAFAYGREAATELLSVELDNFVLGLPPNGAWTTPQKLWRMDPQWAWRAVRPFFDPKQRVVVIAAHGDVMEDRPHQTRVAATWP